MTLFRNKYRVETTRLRNWDYAADGCYFVTICAAMRRCVFGQVIDGRIRVSRAGEIAVDEWQTTPQIRSCVELDAWVVMPNHVHGIIVIHCPGEAAPRNAILDTSNRFGPLKPGSLQSIINGYKGAVTRRCRAEGVEDFAWQARYWEHRVRTENDLIEIRRYIENNPMRWAFDHEEDGGLWM
jgi:REP element-mobilizing transposase RayT